MPDKVFIDSNIWLYALINNQGDSKYQTASSFIFNQHNPVVSYQVIREICSNRIKKIYFQEERIRELITNWYRDCDVIPSNVAQHLLASRLIGVYSLSYWDSLIVPASIDAGCAILYSEDLQNGQEFEECLTVVNPLL
ncbi:MAG: PIN domain-containing protein [Methylomonas sp.]|jgi:predicted nucleic acid-binding protein